MVRQSACTCPTCKVVVLGSGHLHLVVALSVLIAAVSDFLCDSLSKSGLIFLSRAGAFAARLAQRVSWCRVPSPAAAVASSLLSPWPVRCDPECWSPCLGCSTVVVGLVQVSSLCHRALMDGPLLRLSTIRVAIVAVGSTAPRIKHVCDRIV